jgi:hypothetical protein
MSHHLRASSRKSVRHQSLKKGKPWNLHGAFLGKTGSNPIESTEQASTRKIFRNRTEQKCPESWKKFKKLWAKTPQPVNRSHPLLTPRIPAVFKKVWRIRKNDAFLRKAKVDSFAYKPLT